MYPLLIESATIPEGNEYGKDWVYFGFLAGDETAAQQLGVNLRMTKVDYYGTPLDEIPIMNGIYDYSDVDLIVVHTGYPELARAGRIPPRGSESWPG